MSYREIPFGFGVCVECDQVVELGKRRVGGMPVLLGHGPAVTGVREVANPVSRGWKRPGFPRGTR